MSSAEDIQRESEERRAHVTALIEELRNRLSPGAIVDELIGPDTGRDLARLAARQLRRQIRRNPLPFAVIGAGVAWLLLAEALRRQRQIPLHDGLDPEDYSEAPAQRGILSGPARVIRHLSQVAATRDESAALETTHGRDSLRT